MNKPLTTRDQAENLRNLVRSHARQPAGDDSTPRLLAVTGGQRGVGATTLAVNLAVSLALQGQRAILVDADLDRGAASAQCGLIERRSIINVLAGRATIHEVLARGPAGIQLLPGVWAPADASNLSAAAQGRLIHQLRGLGTHADVIVIDTGSGRNSFVRRFWQAANLALVVTTAEPMAIMDCYATIKVLLAGDTSIVVRTAVTRAPSAARADEVQNRIAAACRRFLGVRVPAAGFLPEIAPPDDPHDVLTPMVLSSPHSDAAQATERLAEKLWLESRSSGRRATPAAGVSAA